MDLDQSRAGQRRARGPSCPSTCTATRSTWTGCWSSRTLHLLVIEDAAESHGAESAGRRHDALRRLRRAELLQLLRQQDHHDGRGRHGPHRRPRARRAAVARFATSASRERRFLHAELGFNFRLTGFQAAIGPRAARADRPSIARKRAWRSPVHGAPRAMSRVCGCRSRSRGRATSTGCTASWSTRRLGWTPPRCRRGWRSRRRDAAVLPRHARAAGLQRARPLRGGVVPGRRAARAPGVVPPFWDSADRRAGRSSLRRGPAALT